MGHDLEWRVLIIPPNHLFAAHSHAGLEFYYILEGTLHERKLIGEPIERCLWANGKFVDAPDYAGHLDGKCQFVERSFSEGDCNVNEVGSLHQPYTKEDGCVLLVLGCGKVLPIPPKRLPPGHPFFAALGMQTP